VNLRRIAGLLGRLGADLVALQEIDECSVWSGSFDHLDYLRTHAGFPHAAFGISNRRAGLFNLSYGNAILSRFPIIETETIAFGKRRLGEKGFLFAEISVGGRIVPVVNLLLRLEPKCRWRLTKGTIRPPTSISTNRNPFSPTLRFPKAIVSVSLIGNRERTALP